MGRGSLNFRVADAEWTVQIFPVTHVLRRNKIAATQYKPLKL